MALFKGVGDFFALDIGTSAVRVVQLSGGNGSWSLQHYGYAPVDSKVAAADSADSQHRLGEIILTAIGQSGIRTKDVVIGLPSQKTFTTVVDVANMPEDELKSTVKYSLDQYIPMALEDAKVDWKLLGQSLHDPKQLEVLITSTANQYAEERLEFVEGLGLNVIAAEPNPIAMVRALLPPNPTDARLLIDVGDQSTDIVMTYGESPRLVRTVPLGLQSLIRSAVQNLNVQEDQARQFILKFGLATDRLEGQVYRALESTLENFVSELTKSIKFFQTRYPSSTVSGIMVSGYGSSIPRFADYVAAKTSLQTTPTNPWQGVSVAASDQQQLAPIAHEYATAVGLAKRTNR